MTLTEPVSIRRGDHAKETPPGRCTCGRGRRGGRHGGKSRSSQEFWSYGAHNLSGQYNYHWILNNQYNGAHAKLCTGYNGTGTCYDNMAPQYGWWTNFTPVNSVVLYLP